MGAQCVIHETATDGMILTLLSLHILHKWITLFADVRTHACSRLCTVYGTRVPR